VKRRMWHPGTGSGGWEFDPGRRFGAVGSRAATGMPRALGSTDGATGHRSEVTSNRLSRRREPARSRRVIGLPARKGRIHADRSVPAQRGFLLSGKPVSSWRGCSSTRTIPALAGIATGALRRASGWPSQRFNMWVGRGLGRLTAGSEACSILALLIFGLPAARRGRPDSGSYFELGEAVWGDPGFPYRLPVRAPAGRRRPCRERSQRDALFPLPPIPMRKPGDHAGNCSTSRRARVWQ
jgi:hypothetical protein